ncbi:DUF4400 domain-containing protein [Crenobacter sp. SG2305]|uniref:DUF4400 domain-containing protein n=1 Tax=Crenobacter oryzisoli TaxID=3056844 RepID=UPI0025AA4379|nr:DUF4400 domain-containing protein [Crenobacter sp. SG2305]MDN0082493.1 DUF4400 domain-containing protein [Crenobacter sp. SG2305]
MSNGKHLMAWFIVIMVAFWSTPLFITDAQNKERIVTELGTVASLFGEKTHNLVVDNANSLYQALVIQTGLQAVIDARVVSREQQQQSEHFYGQTLTKMSERTNTYLSNAASNFYGLSIRTQLLVMWFPLLIPFLLGAAADGFACRLIKLSSFGYFSPGVHSVAAHALIFLACLPILYLIAPFVMSPFWIPFMALVAAVALRQVIINAQRFFG